MPSPDGEGASSSPVWLGESRTPQDVGGVGPPLPPHPRNRPAGLSGAGLFGKVGERAGVASSRCSLSPAAGQRPMEGTPEFAFSLQTARLTLSGGGGRGEPLLSLCPWQPFPGPAKRPEVSLTGVSWLWGKTDTVNRCCFLLSVVARFQRGLFLPGLKLKRIDTKGSGETVGQSMF